MKSFRRKDGSDQDAAPGRNGECCIHHDKRSNETHASTTDPDARLAKKSNGSESKLAFTGHLLMENGNGLLVDARPETPLHTNGSENDIRCYVTRRKVSAGNRSDVGRDCRDAFLGLAKTCDKLGIAVWDYLSSRLKVAGSALVQPLDRYVRGRFRPA